MDNAIRAYRFQEAVMGTAERAFADLYQRILNWTEAAAAFYAMDLREQGDGLMDKAIAALYAMDVVLAQGAHADNPVDRDIALRCRVLTRWVLEQSNRARNSGRAQDLEGVGERLHDLSEIFLAMDQVNGRGLT
jgi:hypothetical protein